METMTETVDMLAPLAAWITFSVAVYLISTLVAFARGHTNRLAILLLNLFLGWTLLGWVAALVWSAMSPNRVIVVTR